MRLPVSEMGDHLDLLLARAYVLYSAAHRCREVAAAGGQSTLAAALEKPRDDLAATVNQVAARIGSLGVGIPRTIAEIARLRTIPPRAQTPEEILDHLAAGHAELIREIRSTIRTASRLGDDLTPHLLSPRRDVHLISWRWLRRMARGVGSCPTCGGRHVRPGSLPSSLGMRRALRCPELPAA